MSCSAPWTVIAYATGVSSSATSVCAQTLSMSHFDFGLTGSTYLLIFLLTCLIEAPFVSLAFGRRWFLPVTLILNLATHPAICFLFVRWVGDMSFANYVLAAEAFAFATEFAIASLILKKPAWWILVANLASWSAGALL